MITTRLYKPKDRRKVIKFMKSVDKDFKPPIDERKGGIEKYLEDVLKKKRYRIYILEYHKLFLFFPKIIGIVMTYKKGEDRVIKYLAIAEEYRQYGHGRGMIETALLDIRKSKKVLLRTWSTNKVALSLYTRLGFKFHKIVKDKDRRGEDRSIYLKIDSEDIENLKNKEEKMSF